MWWFLFVFLISVSTIVMFFRGPVAALGFGVFVSLLFPCWIVNSIAGTPIDLRIAISVVLLVAIVVHPKRRISWKFTLGDWAVFSLYFVNVVSDAYQDGLMLSQFVRTFGEWSVPYIAGRLAIQNSDDWRWLTHIAVIVATILAFWATTEAITRNNTANLLFGARPADRTTQMQMRAGVKRAEGPTRHPIWFGMIQALLLPWTITAAYRGLHKDGPEWWMATPFLGACGILASASRGPVVASFVTFGVMTYLLLPRWQKPLMISFIVLTGVGLVARNQLFDLFEAIDRRDWNSKTRVTKVDIDGTERSLTAMSARWLVIEAYRPALLRAGFLGFGTERTAVFPINVPFGPNVKQTIANFWTIDCGYLLLVLRLGWMGIFAFISICILSTMHIIRQAQFVPHCERILPFAIASSIIAVTIVLMVEWMPHDYGFMFLWLCGAANGPRLSSEPLVIRTNASAGKARLTSCSGN